MTMTMNNYYSLFSFLEVNIAPTPNMDAVSSRNCATRYRTDSCICPGGGVMKPAMPKPTAEMNEAMAMMSWIRETVFILCGGI